MLMPWGVRACYASFGVSLLRRLYSLPPVFLMARTEYSIESLSLCLYFLNRPQPLLVPHRRP
ncbi:hypothetical protein I41_19640 [Lacipirellula limnantheis]|uniref:Uncharacterized protein n=1 Tax=Lacipirellula limnantheis TaxID=2528024 RepID=A0A517TWP1_9BACT|nr:hypothetical protein I41_19640 [Lacipirellula limnantheis]